MMGQGLYDKLRELDAKRNAIEEPNEESLRLDEAIKQVNTMLDAVGEASRVERLAVGMLSCDYIMQNEVLYGEFESLAIAAGNALRMAEGFAAKEAESL